MAALYDYREGFLITAGLQGSNVCDEALKMATAKAKERNAAVLLEDDDGTWIVNPDGSIEDAAEPDEKAECF